MKKKIILFPGRLTSWKGQEMFIESLNMFKQKNPDKKFYAIIYLPKKIWISQ